MAVQVFTGQAVRSGINGRAIRAWIWQSVVTMARMRETRRHLREMDPRMLADVGLSRAEAAVEAARPMWDMTVRRHGGR